MADGCHFEKPLNHHNPATVQQIATKFGMKTHSDHLKPSNSQNFEFYQKAPQGGCGHRRQHTRLR